MALHAYRLSLTLPRCRQLARVGVRRVTGQHCSWPAREEPGTRMRAGGGLWFAGDTIGRPNSKCDSKRGHGKSARAKLVVENAAWFRRRGLPTWQDFQAKST